VNPGLLPRATAGPRHQRLTGALLGAFFTVAGLALACVTSFALDRLVSHRIDEGLALLAAVVGARWLVAELLEIWFARQARGVRHRWRAVILDFFLVPRTSSSPTPVELAGAIDTIVDEPRLEVIRASAQAAILALVIIWLSGGWQALGIVLVLLAIAVPLYQRAGTRAAAFDAQYVERRTRLAERQLDLLEHAPELRALGAVDYGAQEIDALSNSEHQVALRAIRAALGSSLVTEFLAGVSVGLVAMDVGFGLLHGHISLLRALIAVLVTSEFFAHVRRYGVEFHRREAITTARQRLSVPLGPQFSGADVLESIDLVTPAHPEPVNLAVNRGDRIAVLGPSGVGKTTLAHTLLGWRTPRQGRVQRTDESVAYVSADTSLVQGTLAANLRLGAEISDAVLIRTLSDMGLTDTRFSRLDTEVSADGEGFSSGERVRLLIARALLHSPRLLILDDVAGLLDEESRSAVRRAMDQHPDMAIIEISVDDTAFISAATKVRLS
jgi:ABC-type transport system involved in cytochrome bd biosynthesis fused ATPase/permease subunit